MNNRQEFPNIIRAIGERTKMEYLCLQLSEHAAIFEFARRATASRVDANGWKDRFHTRFSPFPLRGRLAFNRLILGSIADSASLSESNALYCAPANPFTCFSDSAQ